MNKTKLKPDKIKELYWKRNLSLRQIAKQLGWCMTSIRKFMVKYDIPRRPSTRRKIIKPNKKTLVELYIKKKFNMNKTAKRLDVSLSTIFRWMEEYGIKRRSIEKYKKFPFSNNIIEKAYLLGLRYGDLSANRHCKLINVEISTTHPSMIQLFYEVFQKYGTPCQYSRYNKITKRSGWKVYILLDKSFEFLLDKKYQIENNKYFYNFLAGFFDAEGCLFIYDNHGCIGLSALIYNNDKELLIKICNTLKGDGFNPRLVKMFKKGEKTTNGYYRKDDTFAVALYTRNEVIRFIKKLPIRHNEKIHKANIILNLSKEDKWEDISKKVSELRNQIKKDTKNCVTDAMNKWVESGKPL